MTVPNHSSPDGVRPVWTNDAGTMAEATAKSRWPGIIANMVTDIEETLAVEACPSRDEGMGILARLRGLQRAIEENHELKPLSPNGGDDIALYNQQLAAFGGISWHAAPWLYAECYIYRHVQTIFDSTSWRGYDVFQRQKESTFASSRVAVEELAARFMTLVASPVTDQASSAMLLFEEMVQISLWGNATDLSLLSNLSVEQIQSLQGSEAIKMNRRNIVANDTQQVWEMLSNSKPSRVDIVLDNAGFEFFADLVFAAYLLHASLAEQVLFHAKDFPWFVSDVTPPDVESVLGGLESADIFSSRVALDPLCRLLRKHFDTGKMVVRSHPFWTTASDFHALPLQSPGLFRDLQESALVVFKGDLNYRKLTIDGTWPHTTPFEVALGPMGKASGVKVLALRTNKADVCVGISSDEQLAMLEKEAPHSAWIKNGKYAVVSYSSGA